jgi:hypothetical protein
MAAKYTVQATRELLRCSDETLTRLERAGALQEREGYYDAVDVRRVMALNRETLLDVKARILTLERRLTHVEALMKSRNAGRQKIDVKADVDEIRATLQVLHGL